MSGTELYNTLYLATLFGGLFILAKIVRAQWTIYKVNMSFVVYKPLYALSHIPTIGPKGLLSSYYGGYQFIRHAREMIQEGYTKYHGRAFKVRMPDQWVVVVTGPDMINDLRKASDDHMGFEEAVKDTIQTDYTLGKAIRLNNYHLDVVRTTLTRNIAARFSDVRDEIINAFSDEIPVSTEWTAFPALPTVMKVVCRTTNRLFVGVPLCREPDYVRLNIEFTIDVFKAARIINLFPDLLKPVAGNLLTPLATAVGRALRHLAPIIEDRLEKEEQYGRDWPGRPNDLISWLLDENPQGELRTVRDLTMRILNINMAAIHTTSMAYTNVLYHLAIQPEEVITALREEVQSVTDELGWNKVAMGHLRRMDSFMKEAARHMGTGAMTVDRMVLKDFTFSDGTTLPAGTRVTVPGSALHHDERYYENPQEFRPFRFSDMRANEGESIKHQMITPNSEYFFFGHGRHSCPGRFFAVNELKTLVAHTLLTYDVKLEGDRKEIPEPFWFSRAVTPNRTAKVLFRKRKV
ncbi:cytochrome P450 [Dendrothele bispora CBS 962.96]|uniref:Cytochrome P450 n=1 Tax=Dendrothele bispora (strain CBS 962.96) TaxID=1314807 RepID=A0A4V4HHC3_DENBC|nr:cytochrome P450 [Dendrothele bispora CBS 962.96]